MKKYFLFMAVALLALSASAARQAYNIVSIHLKDSSKVDLVITDNVKMKFTDSHLIVDGTGSEVAIERANLDKFTHSYDEGASVDDIVMSDKVRIQGDNVIFYGLPDNTPVSVYTLSGTEVLSTVAEGDYVLDLNGLNSGIYMISAQGNSLKLIVK